MPRILGKLELGVSLNTMVGVIFGDVDKYSDQRTQDNVTARK